MNYEQNKHKINTLWNDNIQNENNIDNAKVLNTKYQVINFAKINTNIILTESTTLQGTSNNSVKTLIRLENFLEEYIPYIQLYPLISMNDIYLSNLSSFTIGETNKKYELDSWHDFIFKYLDDTNYELLSFFQGDLSYYNPSTYQISYYPLDFQLKIVLNFPKKYYELRRNKT